MRLYLRRMRRTMAWKNFFKGLTNKGSVKADEIAWTGIERLRLGLTDGLDFAARPRWPLDPEAAPVRGAGVKA